MIDHLTPLNFGVSDEPIICTCADISIRRSLGHDDEVWNLALGWGSWRVLCVECLEDRLGRRLIASDFPDVPCNAYDPQSSGLLLDRMGRLS